MESIKLLFVIPSYQPTDKLIEVVKGLFVALRKQSDIVAKVIVVDDGSGQAYFDKFQSLKSLSEEKPIILTHGVNLGKGRALKTAFNYFICYCSDFDGIVTLDSDGQHLIGDILSCVNDFKKDKNNLVLGCRNFDLKLVPIKSRFGNKLTRTVLRYLCGISLSDTQTGLRVIPQKLVGSLMNVAGERFEFETNMLLEAKNLGISMSETQISTTYQDGNKGTHFNPLKDSIRIYAVFFKYIVASLSSFLIDISIYTILTNILRLSLSKYILLSTIIARLFSAIWNFSVNKNIVFHSKNSQHAWTKYVALLIVNMLVSGELTALLFESMPILHEVGAKIIIDAVMFFLNFWIQKKFIFINRI